MLIRLSQTPTTGSGSGFGGVKLSIGWRGDVTGYTEQRAKGVEGIKTAVKAEGKFVEIGLQVLRTDAMVDTTQPGFEIGEHKMNDPIFLSWPLEIWAKLKAGAGFPWIEEITKWVRRNTSSMSYSGAERP